SDYFVIHFKQTGLPAAILSPVSFNRPFPDFRLKITISSLFWLPANIYFAVGSKLKFLGALPRVDWKPLISRRPSFLILKMAILSKSPRLDAYKCLPSGDTW